MKINSINSTNFNGIYRLPNTRANIKVLEEHVLPQYDFIRKEKFFAFIGSNPFKANLTALINHIAQHNNVSIEELKTQAKKDGLNIDDLGDDTIHIITGNKDNERYNDFLAKRFSEQTDDVQKVQCFFSFYGQNLKLPGYLKNILGNIILDEQENMAFNNFAKKIINVKTPQELLQKALTEK